MFHNYQFPTYLHLNEKPYHEQDKVEITPHTESDLKIIITKEVQAQATTCGICSFLDIVVATLHFDLYLLTCPVVVHPYSTGVYPVH